MTDRVPSTRIQSSVNPCIKAAMPESRAEKVIIGPGPLMALASAERPTRRADRGLIADLAYSWRNCQ